MKKYITFLLTAALALNYIPADSTKAYAAVEKSYTFEKGLYDNETFTISLPEGWCLHEDSCTENQAEFYKADKEEDYDPSSNPSIFISISDYSLEIEDRESWLNEAVARDMDYFTEDVKTDDVSIAFYKGKVLSGKLKDQENLTGDYYNLDHWQEDSDMQSIMQIKVINKKEDPYPVEEILETLEVKLDAGEESDDFDDEFAEDPEDSDQDQTENTEEISESDSSESSEDQLTDPTLEDPEEEEIEEEAGTVELAAANMPLSKDWYIMNSNPDEVTLGNITKDDAIITLTCNKIEGGKTSQEWADILCKNFGGEQELKTYEINTYNFIGIQPADDQYYLFCDSSDGKYVLEITIMGITLEETTDLFKELKMP